jgi:GT2 family glycosyltransferase
MATTLMLRFYIKRIYKLTHMTYNEPMVDLSIIILSYNTKELTKKCVSSIIDSLKENPDMQYEIIVLDNASTDGSVEMLKNINHQLNNVKFLLIESDANLGFSKGNNRAAEKAQGTNLLFLNSDTEVINNAIPEFLAWFEKSGFQSAGARLLNDDKSIQKSAGRFYSLFVSAIALFLKGDYWGFSRYAPSATQRVDWVSGAALIMTASVFRELHGFDEKIFMYWDEVDLLYRSHKKGYSTGYFPKAEFIHYEGQSSSSRQQPILRVYEGYIYFYKKHYSRLHLQILRYMLKLKAIVSLTIGKLTSNVYLIDTYKKAYEVAQMD